MGDTVDLNADMGESFGPWNMGDDEALLDVVTSANVACGFHAGDPDVMVRTMKAAAARGVGIGAHPGFPDLQGFGRRRMQIPAETIQNAIRYQLGAALGVARSLGATVRHFKLHGALSNMACEDRELARACFEAAISVSPDIVIMVLAATPMQDAAEALECKWAAEVFADRAYNDDGTLVDRSRPDAMIRDPAVAGPRMAKMVRDGAIPTVGGGFIETRVDTICVHGDSAEALALARGVRASLESEGIALRSL